VVLNFTAGMGGDMTFGDVENPLPLNEAGTDMAGASERVAHVAECLPEICTLDCGTMNFAEADYVMTNTPGMLRAMGQMMTDLGVRPEIEVFETGHLWFAKQLVEEGIIEDPVMIQMCMGIPWGAPDDLNTFMAMVNNTPAGWTYSAFSIRRAGRQPVAGKRRAGDQRAAGRKSRHHRHQHGLHADDARRGARKAAIAETRPDREIGARHETHRQGRDYRRRGHRRRLDRAPDRKRHRCHGLRSGRRRRAKSRGST
jgi:hypothetical protein